ncbi:hypothetical protein CkaCkLH20_00836 [Colletotrichum karsti]|uniref:LITAF domain-containing protein n=1 Tax=Colletotrichum karsti TaxID=1095194 RepID=A0A9P6IFC3_9PEZI|nr:uncharacterized protein CkaCkLH20_00836 [Colletotrichum karsti]KAF9881690.1 hypothetical protein CkaCkLH20_00836 [Colletotrichum karsti]
MSSKAAPPVVSTPPGSLNAEPARNSTATSLRSSSPVMEKETPKIPDVASENDHASKNPTNQEEEVTPIAELDGDKPQTIDCPFCKQRTKTTVKKTGEFKQLMMRTVSGVFFFLVCCVPSMVGWCVDLHYSCSECHMKVAARPHKGRMIVYKPKE